MNQFKEKSILLAIDSPRLGNVFMKHYTSKGVNLKICDIDARDIDDKMKSVDVFIVVLERIEEGRFTQISHDELQNIYRHNCCIPQLMITSVANAMVKRGHEGRIIVISKTTEKSSIADISAKTYLAGYMNYLNAELGKNKIHGNIVNIVGEQDRDDEAHLLETVDFLSFDRSANILGQTVTMCGNGGVL